MNNKKCYKCLILLNQENKVKDRNLCKICSRQISKDYKARNKELISEYNKIYKSDNKETISEYNKKYHNENIEAIQKRHNLNDCERRKNDPCFKLAHNCRTRLNKIFKGSKSQKTFDLLDCDITFLKDWLEYNFKEGMNFENYGSHWHIDHVIPCSLFDLTSEDEIKNCFRWTNLQPLEAKINIIKNNNINQVEVISHYNKVNEYTKFKKKKLYNFDYNKYF